MAPIKFEEELKEGLEQRRIEPSTSAWETLSSKLDKQDSKQHKKTYWWLAVAASVVGVLLTVTLFLNKPGEPEIKVTDVNKIDVQTINKEGKNFDASEKDIEKTTDERVVHEDQQLMNKSSDETQKNIKKQNPSKSVLSKKTILEQAIVETHIQKENDIKEVVEMTSEGIQMKEVVAQIQELKAAKSQVTDAEIDKLLKDAEKRIKSKQNYISEGNKVDATALLQDVEEGIEQSFRDKVFEALKTSYSKVKTAVAQRND